MVVGIMGVMEVNMVAKQPTPNWMVGNFLMEERLPNDMTKCVATAVMRNSNGFRMSGDTVSSMSTSSGLANQFRTSPLRPL